jgi:crotonobetainyl-CoA:carnitine CoA-transferase CaiB-like acyl-CoA transferase
MTRVPPAQIGERLPDGSSREVSAAAVGPLRGLRVIELADERAEYCGMVLAGLGASVIKVEPPGGSPTRRIGPYVDDIPGPDRSLFFWHYNRGKQSVVLDMEQRTDAARFDLLMADADVLLESTPRGWLTDVGYGPELMAEKYPKLITARMTAFGDDGPWADFVGSDLIHLALGGVTMNCGYDPDLSGEYDLPPIAPQMWHAYHVAGDQLAIGIMAAVLYRLRTGHGQAISCSIHEAVSKCTELDVMSWVMRRLRLDRQTCRHAREVVTAPTIAHTKDGRWFMNFAETAAVRRFLAELGMPVTQNPDGERPQQGALIGGRAIPGSGSAMGTEETMVGADLAQRIGRRVTYDDLPWAEAQASGLMWSPMRLPHENALDNHWHRRGTFAEIEHPELGRKAAYPIRRWLSTAPAWVVPGPASSLAEAEAARPMWSRGPRTAPVAEACDRVPTLSMRGKPFPLQGVRILDFSWFLASAGGTRFLAALGAETLKVEWKGKPDTRMGAMAPIGGREARRRASAALPPESDPDMGGQFNNKNSGKRGMSLNVRHPKGLEIARRLIEVCDVVAEGFSPGVMDKWGLGYSEMKKIRPDIIYVQQSGMGAQGEYGRLRAVGPIAASFVGLSEMSGLPRPAAPAGWGYSYLDWIGAYSFAQAILTALYYRDTTGEGQWIDASQCEAGLFITGTAVVDWSVNGRGFERYGNRSPHKAAAPHGIYRCAGRDRWIALGCFTDQQWLALARAAGLSDDMTCRFATMQARIAEQDVLDAVVGAWTVGVDAYDAMAQLQAAGVPAGVCQTAEDRCDRDPQLQALDWLVEVTGTKIGTWPVPELPVKMTASPPYIGGITNRGAPIYGEDTRTILKELLEMSDEEIDRLAAEDVI